MKLKNDFVLIDESVVDRGYRVLMSGADLKDFIANPVMLFMHNRAGGNSSFATLPIGRWYDIRIEDNKLKAKPEFDDDDEFAVRIQKKVQNGFLSAASIWVKPIEASNDPKLLIAGQDLPTITKWGVKECSIVDIPGCSGAVALLNSSGSKMNTESPAEIGAVKNYLQSLARPAAEQRKEPTALPTVTQWQAVDLVNSAYNKGILTSQDKQTFLQLAANNPATVVAAVSQKQPDGELSALLSMSATELWEKGKLQRLQALHPEFYEVMHNDCFLNGKGNDSSRLSAFAKQVHSRELAALLTLSAEDLYSQGKLERLKAISQEHYQTKHKELYETS